MNPETVIAHEFVEFIPDELKERTLYVSLTYCTAVHKCCCGCGREVVTPLSPTGWQLTFDGKTVSLNPSIGSWSQPCQSHYFITKSRVAWAPTWTKKQIARGRAHEAREKGKYYLSAQAPSPAEETPNPSPPTSPKPTQNPWQRIKKWFS
jgi:hypothetical protein